MPSPKQPEILSPGASFPTSRLGSGGRFFSNENLDILAHVLDDCFRIPGTQIHFGLDGIVGLVPAIGDVLAGLASCILIFAAWVRGVPYVTLARMAVESGDRRGRRRHSVPRRRFRYCVESQPPQLQAAHSPHRATPPPYLERLAVSGGPVRSPDGDFRRASAGACMDTRLAFASSLTGLNAPRIASKHLFAAIQSNYRGVAQPGSASALGAEGRGFESLRPDHPGFYFP